MNPQRALSRRRTTGTQRVWILTGLMAGLMLALFLTSLAHLGTHGVSVEFPWWSLVLTFTVVDVFLIHVRVGRSAHSLSLIEVPLVLGLTFFSPGELLLAHLIGGAIAQVVVHRRRQSILRVAFNLAMWGLSTSLAVIVFRSLSPEGSPFEPQGWLAVFAATFVADIFSTVVINVAIALSEQRRLGGLLSFDISAAFVFVSTSLGIVAAVVIWTFPAATWFIGVLAVVVLLAFRANASLQQKHDVLLSLYDSTRIAQETLEIEPMLRSLLVRARDMFHAELAEIILFGSSPEDEGLEAIVRLGEEEPTTKHLLTKDLWRGPWAPFATVSDAMLFPRPVTSEGLGSNLVDRGIKDAITAPLGPQGKFSGLLIVANREGDFATFDETDLKTLETLANHLSVSLDNAGLVTSLRQKALENYHQATHDQLTDLPNRKLFYEAIEDALEGIKKSQGYVGVMLLDVDRFKEVNDTLGHHNGDLLLTEIARRLRNELRSAITVARLGGDEFAIVVPDGGAVTEITDLARTVIDLLSEPLILDGLSLEVSASIGIALAPEDGMDAATLMQRADVAMYLAKEGATGFELYDRGRDHYSASRLTLVGELRAGIANGELELAFQPKADTLTGEVTGTEALLRWRHPRRGMVFPDEFIGLAEQTGLIRPLTLYVLDHALAQTRAWLDDGLNLTVAVNLSARNLHDANLPLETARLLEKWKVPPSLLQLEITETTVMSDSARTQRALDELSALGIGLSVDDFGTGYSSLSYLRKLPVNEIKIDRSFVMGMLSEENDALIVQSIVDLGRNLGLKIVAEGVENREIWDRLAILGCHTIQGYHLSKPISPLEFRDWLARYEVGVTTKPGARIRTGKR